MLTYLAVQQVIPREATNRGGGGKGGGETRAPLAVQGLPLLRRQALLYHPSTLVCLQLGGGVLPQHQHISLLTLMVLQGLPL